MNNFLGYYSPAKVVSPVSEDSECYNIVFYTGEKAVCHRKYILTHRDPKYYSVKVESLEEINKVLDPELTSNDKERLVATVKKHQNELKSIILGQLESTRDRLFLFDHQRRSALFGMSRAAPFRPNEFSYLCKYLADDFIQECKERDTTFQSAVVNRFSSADHVFKMSISNYVLLVLAPELVIREIMERYPHLTNVDEASAFYLENHFESETSYVTAMYASRDMYRYIFSETKSKN